MKKTIASIMLLATMSFGTAVCYAQTVEAENAEQVEMTAEEIAADSAAMANKAQEEAQPVQEAEAEEVAPVVEENISLHQQIKIKFIEGGVTFMFPVLLCLILGLALAIERIITLNLSTTNNRKLLEDIENALDNGGTEAAIEVCKNTRGPVASIFTQGLMRAKEGIDMVEKSVVSYGSVQMAMLEKGLVWISLFIALAPMLGFMGTVIGMIDAFDTIEAVGDISPSIVAHGIKVALLTTVGGLIVAIILQLFYNYCVSKIDSLVTEMEDASISLIDILVRKNVTK